MILPVRGGGAVVVAAPGSGPGFWAGASSAAFGPDGRILIAYRLRSPGLRGADVVVATSEDGLRLTTVAVLHKETFAAESLERPAVVRTDDGWRLFVSCATPGSKHWRIDVLDAVDPASFDGAAPRTVLPGSAQVGVKDPVIRRAAEGWQAWICCHPLEEAGEEDRMTTAFATSDDGLSWHWHGTVLQGRPGMWDGRGARVTAILPDGRATYDGRASKEENFSERTGLAIGAAHSRTLTASGDAPIANVRYVDVVPGPYGETLVYYERPRPDGSHDLCLERHRL